MDQDSAIVDIALYLSYFLVIFAVAAAIILPLIKSLDHPQSLLKVAGGFIVLLVIFGIGYALSSSDPIPGISEDQITSQGIKAVGAALIAMYILLIIAIVSIAVTEVSKYFR